MCAFTNIVVDQNVWYVDSEATQHMTPQNDWFKGYIPSLTQEMVYLGDNIFHKIEGHGFMGIKFLGGVIKYIEKVFHIFGLWRNLISVNQVDDLEHKLEFTAHACFIKDKDGIEIATT